MWDKNTSIYEPEVVRIKNAILENGLAEASAFEVHKNFDISSGATHYPVVFIVDVSSSLRAERENLNRAINSFAKDILESRTTLSSSIDFAIVTFGDTAKVKRPFGYITEEDISNSSQKCTIREQDIEGLTKMGSGMFLAWYIAEARKLMYKKAGLYYKQPIFVLISDLGNNERTQIGEDYLITKIISLFNMKYDGHKLGLLKALFGTIDNNYNNNLKGTIIDAPTGFADMLSTLFAMLVSTIAANENPDRYLSSDEDDGVFLVYGGFTNSGNNDRFTSGKLEKLKALFDDDDADK